jgi:hypothetical protein
MVLARYGTNKSISNKLYIKDSGEKDMVLNGKKEKGRYKDQDQRQGTR